MTVTWSYQASNPVIVHGKQLEQSLWQYLMYQAWLFFEEK